MLICSLKSYANDADCKQWHHQEIADRIEVGKDLRQQIQESVKGTIKFLNSDAGTLPLLPIRSFSLPEPFKSIFFPKTHKTNNPGRPFVSANSSPTELFSSYFDSFMLSIVQSQMSFLYLFLDLCPYK